MKKYLRSNLEKFNHFKNLLFYNNTKYIVIIYHRVLPYKIEDPTDNYILQEDFEKQISYLNKNYEIVDINSIQLLNNNKKPKIIITFDDGYYDNYLYAYPILKSHKISSIFFIPTYYIDNKKIIWDKLLSLILIFANNHSKKLIIRNLQNKIIFNKSYNYNFLKKDFWFLINYLKKTNISFIENLLFDLIDQLDNPIFENKLDYCIGKKEIKELSTNNMHIGSHANYHLSLRNYDDHNFCNEIIESKNKIETIIEKKCQYFSFPFGSKDDFTYNQINLLVNLGFKKCFLNIKGLNNNNKNTIYEKRIIMHAFKNLKYILG